MARSLPILAIAVLAFPGPAVAQDSDADRLENRLRGCLLTGASAAPRTSLAAALQSTRTFCRGQIAQVADHRIAEATAGLESEAAEDARRRTLRHLNNEIAHAVANFTGLTH